MARDASEALVILIAERDQNMRALQQFFLDKAGYAVEFAEDGEAALLRAQVASPALIVTEILLPKIDGLALCRRLAEDPTTRDIPVIVFSVLAAATRAAEAGAKAFLRKPLVESVFVSMVAQLIAANSNGMRNQ